MFFHPDNILVISYLILYRIKIFSSRRIILGISHLVRMSEEKETSKKVRRKVYMSRSLVKKERKCHVACWWRVYLSCSSVRWLNESGKLSEASKSWTDIACIRFNLVTGFVRLESLLKSSLNGLWSMFYLLSAGTPIIGWKILFIFKGSIY